MYSLFTKNKIKIHNIIAAQKDANSEKTFLQKLKSLKGELDYLFFDIRFFLRNTYRFTTHIAALIQPFFLLQSITSRVGGGNIVYRKREFLMEKYNLQDDLMKRDAVQLKSIFPIYFFPIVNIAIKINYIKQANMIILFCRSKRHVYVFFFGRLLSSC